MKQHFEPLQGSRTHLPSPVFFSTLHNKLFFIEVCRLIFYVLSTFSFLIFQITNRPFVIPELNTTIYIMLFLAFSLNTIYLLLFYNSKYLFAVVICLFMFDSVFISTLIHVTDISQPIFVFLYMINILLCGLIFPWRGAFFLALWTSLLFSFLLILNPDMTSDNFVFALLLNNLSFFLVAFLSSYLSHQMGFMEGKIEHQTQNIHTLQDINTLILETMPSGLLVFNNDGLIMQSNASAKKILEKDLSGLQIQSVLEDIKQHLACPSYQKIRQVLWESKYQATSSQSSQKLLGLTLAPLKMSHYQEEHSKGVLKSNEVDNLLGHILLIQDLTNMKELEKIARRNEKMAAIGQLAAGIAHEIRNPLASISGSVQLLQVGTSQNAQKKGLKEENEKLYSIVLREIDRLNLLITDFLNYAKPQEKPNDPIEINHILKETLKRIKFNKELPQHVQQHTDLRAVGCLLGQFERLEQVFLNLVINAYQAMEHTHPADLFVTSYNKKGSICVSVKDTGPGFSQEVKERIFEPFLTTKTSGTGLGLATVHKILQAHEAKVHLVSEKNQGTEFLIEFTRLSQ